METYFASPLRDEEAVISQQVRFASKNPIINGVLGASGGILVVLNQHRQIIAVNDTLISLLGIDNPNNILGLRPGEALGCIHAHELSAGCGTSKWCSTCGAATAIVASLADKKPVERKCAMTVKRGASSMDLCFSVRSTMIQIEQALFVLLYLQDISADEQRVAFERMFNHDIKNLLTGITCTADMLDSNQNPDAANSIHTIQKLSLRLRNEILLHASLSDVGGPQYSPVFEKIESKTILGELEQFFQRHHAAQDKLLLISDNEGIISFNSDYSLLLRVLTNLLVNAFEATDPGGTVRCSVGRNGSHVIFTVQNNAFITPENAKRVFQQYFSTKPDSGRGFGTFGSKRICETYLKGTVDFETSEQDGTVFKVMIPG